MNIEKFEKIISKSCDKLLKESLKQEPYIYFMSNNQFDFLIKANKLIDFCKYHLYDCGVTRLCLVERKQLYEIYQDGSIKLLKEME